MRRTRPFLAAAAALVLLAAACGDTDDPNIAETGTTSAPSETAGLTIVGEDIAFDVTDLDATVGETFAITFENRDDGIMHNLHVEGTSSGDAVTDIEEGPTTQTLEVSFDEVGEFEFFCDVHPQEMRGTITVTP
ncbi:MAG: cupredoxin domain-containing protein [Acidimicrobiia bacterium]